MGKYLHAVEFDGITFGMEIETDTIAFKNFKKNIKLENCISIFGDKFKAYVVSHLWLGAIMREAHWLVTENKEFQKFTIDGFLYGEEIYVKYTDEPIDFRNRQAIKGGVK